MPRNKRKRKNDLIKSYKRLCKNLKSSPNIIDELKYHLNGGIDCNLCKNIMNEMIFNTNIDAIKLLINNGYDLTFSLLKSVKYNNYEITNLLLVNGAYTDPMECYNGDTPLHISIRNGNDLLIKLLICYGCNPDIDNYCGHTPLMVAIKLNQISTVKLLLNYCNPNLTINKKTRSGIFREHKYFKEVILFGGMELFRILVPYTSLENLYQGLKLIKNHSTERQSDQLKIELIQTQILKIKTMMYEIFNFDIFNNIITYLS